MHIPRATIRLISLLALLVAVIAANVTYARVAPTYEAQGEAAILTLQREYGDRFAALAAQQTFFHESPAHIAPLSADAAVVVEALNSGETVADVRRAVDQSRCQPFERSWRQLTDSTSCAFRLKHARGDLKVLVVQFAEPSVPLTNSEVSDRINAINQPVERVALGDEQLLTYQYLPTYFETEAAVFGVPFSLEITTLPPVTLTAYPPYAGKTRQEQLNELSLSRTFFLKELAARKVDVRDYDGVVIVALNNHYNDFVSFAIPAIRATVVDFSLNGEWKTNSSLAVMAHEMGHLFGASDQYLEAGGCQTDASDQYTSDLHPSLMCRHSSIDRTRDYYSVINTRAAREMGWIK